MTIFGAAECFRSDQNGSLFYSIEYRIKMETAEKEAKGKKVLRADATTPQRMRSRRVSGITCILYQTRHSVAVHSRYVASDVSGRIQVDCMGRGFRIREGLSLSWY